MIAKRIVFVAGSMLMLGLTVFFFSQFYNTYLLRPEAYRFLQKAEIAIELLMIMVVVVAVTDIWWRSINKLYAVLIAVVCFVGLDASVMALSTLMGGWNDNDQLLASYQRQYTFNQPQITFYIYGELLGSSVSYSAANSIFMIKLLDAGLCNSGGITVAPSGKLFKILTCDTVYSFDPVTRRLTEVSP